MKHYSAMNREKTNQKKKKKNYWYMPQHGSISKAWCLMKKWCKKMAHYMSPCINTGHSEKGKPVLRDRLTAATVRAGQRRLQTGAGSSQMMKASLIVMTGGGGGRVLTVSYWERINLTIDKLYLQISAKTSCSQSGDPGSIPGQGTRSHLPPLRVWMLQLKIMHATTKTQLSQITNLF